MKKALSLSIVIPAYNESRYIRQCLNAIQTQTIMPDEVIVVDNNSSDDTAKIAKEYDFVKVIHEKNQGVVYARDAGLNAAKSTIIGRIDVDTILPPNWVEKIMEFYSDANNADCAWTCEGYFYNIDFPRLNSWILTQVAFKFNKLILGHYFLWGASMAMPKTAWETIKSSTCIRNDIHEDIDIAIHLNKMGFETTYDNDIKVAVVMKRVLDDQSQLWKYLQLWPETLRAHGKKTWPLAYSGAVLLWAGSPLIVVIRKTTHIIQANKRLVRRIIS